MQRKNAPDSVPDVAERLHVAVDNMLAPFGKEGMRGRTTILAPDPFDVSKPNQHDTKAEFQRELDAVSGSLEHLDAALDLLGSNEDDPEHLAMINRLIPVLHQKMYKNAPRDNLGDSIEIIRKNVAEVGGYTGAFLVMLDFSLALTERYQELKDQEEKFWNLKHRAPDYYARAIALRLAKLFAQETGQKPTYGTAASGDHLSTSYGRALEEVFAILEINQKVRTHAKWAIDQITEEDLKPPPVNYLARMVGGQKRPNRADSIKKIADALISKRSQP